MQKKILTLILLLSTLFFTSFVFAQDAGLKYDLVSYSENSQDRANTPFFNISIFNQKSYTVNYQNFATGFQFFFCKVILLNHIFHESPSECLKYFPKQNET